MVTASQVASEITGEYPYKSAVQFDQLVHTHLVCSSGFSFSGLHIILALLLLSVLLPLILFIQPANNHTYAQ